MNIFDSTSGFFKSFDYLVLTHNIKVIFGLLTFIFLALAIYSYIRAHLLVQSHRKHHGGHTTRSPEATVPGHEQPTETEQNVNATPHAGAWDDIVRFANSVRESEWKLSIIQADKLVDGVLKEKGFHGETMGERLMMIKPDQLQSLQDLWDAHKLRNLLVHDTQYKVTHEQVLAAIRSFERVLRELGAL